MTYFSLEEMRCRDGTEYPEEWRTSRLVDLFATLNLIREKWGDTLVINSGYRSPTYNAKIKGAPKSQHVQGRAADIRPAGRRHTPEEVERLHNTILGMHSRGELPLIGGVGKYPLFVHVDVRPEGRERLRRWNGGGE